MFGNLFGKRATTKSDVVMSIAMAVIGVWKAYDTSKQYKIEQEVKEIDK